MPRCWGKRPAPHCRQHRRRLSDGSCCTHLAVYVMCASCCAGVAHRSDHLRGSVAAQFTSLWEAAFLCFLFYVTVRVPFFIAFTRTSEWYTLIGDNMSTVFFILDIVVRCCACACDWRTRSCASHGSTCR